MNVNYAKQTHLTNRQQNCYYTRAHALSLIAGPDKNIKTCIPSRQSSKYLSEDQSGDPSAYLQASNEIIYTELTNLTISTTTAAEVRSSRKPDEK